MEGGAVVAGQEEIVVVETVVETVAVAAAAVAAAGIESPSINLNRKRACKHQGMASLSLLQWSACLSFWLC